MERRSRGLMFLAREKRDFIFFISVVFLLEFVLSTGNLFYREHRCSIICKHILD